MKRRDFLKTVAIAGGAAAVAAAPHGPVRAAQSTQGEKGDPQPLYRKLPRWRGFNLLEKFNARNDRFVEADFQWIQEWGFDFVRLPMDYRVWTDAEDPYKLKQKPLAEIDEAVESGRKHGVHVSLNLHRAPGYTVAQPPEKLNLWTDEEAQKQFDFQWSQFARRYRSVPSRQLSFNLVNEPANTTPDRYAKVVRRVVAAIRAEDPDRLVIADGLSWGRDPVFELVDLQVAQSTRGYEPMPISHYQASWVGGQRWAEPTWPLVQNGKTLDRQWLDRDRIQPWKKLAARGVGVHVGEWGAFNRTPHDVVLRWARDCLELWQEAGWGWALWNLRGSFGILDSDRRDVAYEEFRGHRLDRQLLDLVRKL